MTSRENLKSHILLVLKNGNFSAVDIAKSINRLKDKSIIQSILYNDLKDKVQIVERDGQRPIWGLIKCKSEVNVAGKMQSKDYEEIIYKPDDTNGTNNRIIYSKYNNGNSTNETSNYQINKLEIDVVSDIDSENSILKKKNIPKIIAIDIDNCQSLVKIVDEYIKTNTKTIVKGYYGPGTVVNFKPSFCIEQVKKGLKDEADCHIQHWISRMSDKYGNTYRYVIISRDNIFINTKNILKKEGLKAWTCGTLEDLQRVLAK